MKTLCHKNDCNPHAFLPWPVHKTKDKNNWSQKWLQSTCFFSHDLYAKLGASRCSIHDVKEILVMLKWSIGKELSMWYWAHETDVAASDGGLEVRIITVWLSIFNSLSLSLSLSHTHTHTHTHTHHYQINKTHWKILVTSLSLKFKEHITYIHTNNSYSWSILSQLFVNNIFQTRRANT